MDWTPTSNRRLRKKRPHFEKSKSEPNLSGHFTPRFPNNLKHLLHEYITVDELKFYRKRKPLNVDNEFSKDHICLYDDSQPIIPFSSLKTEYNKKFGRIYSPRSRSVPNKFDLNATTNELLEALRYDFNDIASNRLSRAKTANISGEIEIDGVDELLKTDMIPYANVRQPNENAESSKTTDTQNRRSCTLKLRGELFYSPEYRSEYKRHSSFERSQSIPQVNNIKFNGKFHGVPEYRDNFKTYDHFSKIEPIRNKDHLKVAPTTINTAIISPTISPSSEYSDKYKELNLRSIERKKYAKDMDNIGMKNNLIVGRCDQQIYPEYYDRFKDPKIKKIPERAKPKSPILSMSGNMDYKPEYRSTYIDFPRRRPLTIKPETHFDFFEQQQSRKTSPARNAIIAERYNPRVAIIEPTKNIHHPTGIDEPSFLCQPEVRKARREILLKKRPPSPTKTLAATVRREGHIFPSNDDEENIKYNERSHILTPKLNPPIQVTIENFDEPNKKPTTILRSAHSPKFGRRASIQHASTIDAKSNLHHRRNQTKIIEGNSDYIKLQKKNSLTSTTTTDDEAGMISRRKFNGDKSHDQAPSFFVLKEPCKETKWMKSSWYN